MIRGHKGLCQFDEIKLAPDLAGLGASDWERKVEAERWRWRHRVPWVNREATPYPGRLVCRALDNECRGRVSLSHGPTPAVVGEVGSGATGVLAY